MEWEISYYDENVEQAILQWPKKILAKYLRITDLMQEEGPDLGMPFTKPMGNGLFEIRPKAHEGIARAFFCAIQNKEIVILHGFVKKTDKTPKKELETARKRLREIKL